MGFFGFEGLRDFRNALRRGLGQELAYCPTCDSEDIDWEWVRVEEETRSHRACGSCCTPVVYWCRTHAVRDYWPLEPPPAFGQQRLIGDADRIFRLCATIGKATSQIKVFTRGGQEAYYVDLGPRHLAALALAEGNRLAS